MPTHDAPATPAALEQQKVLRRILKENSGSSLFGRLGINKLFAYKDFTLLYQAYCRAVPVQSPQTFVETLVVMGQEGLKGQNDPAQVYTHNRMVTTKTPLGLTPWRGQPIPVGSAQVKEFLEREEGWRK